MSLNVAYSDHSSGSMINFLEKIQGAYANYDHAIQQYGNGEFHIDSDKECIIHITSLFKHSDENKMVYEECHHAIRQGKSFNDYICDLHDLYSYMTDAKSAKAWHHVRTAKTDVDRLISGLVQANLSQCDELYIPSKALQLLEAIHPGIHQQYIKHRNEDPDGKLTVIVNNAQPPPPPRDSDNKVPIPRQYMAPLEKEQQTITANLATAEDNDDTSNESESTHPDPEDQLEDPNEQVSQLI